jgi:hypothetical protein
MPGKGWLRGRHMERHWRSREVEVPLAMAAARRMWGHSWRVDTHDCERLGTRRATVLLCREPPGAETCHPIGWVSMRWHLPDDAQAVIDHLAWDEEHGASEAEAWRAVAELAGAELAAGARRHRSVLAA